MIDNRFFIVQHIPKLDWYLVVSKSTSDLTGTLNHYSLQIIMALALGALVILVVTNYAISMYKKQIISLSNIDHLTDIPNRTIFEIALEKAIGNIRYQSFSLVLFDLDNLKRINDSLGHHAGDDTLKGIAELARASFKEPDFVSRVGGDEFGVIIYKTLNESQKLIEEFKNSINNNPNLKRVNATVSIGITEANEKDTVTEIYKRADEALYKSKNAGKDRIHVL